jgi:hypothetical protein
MKPCLVCRKKREYPICETCDTFLREKYGTEYETHKELLLRELGGKNAKGTLEKTSKKTRGGGRR